MDKFVDISEILTDLFDLKCRMDAVEEDRPRCKEIEERLLRVERAILGKSARKEKS